MIWWRFLTSENGGYACQHEFNYNIVLYWQYCVEFMVISSTDGYWTWLLEDGYQKTIMLAGCVEIPSRKIIL